MTQRFENTPGLEDAPVKELAAYFAAEAKKPNVLTKARFERYAVFYRKDTVAALAAADPKAKPEALANLRALTKQFLAEIDPFKPIQIVASDADGTVLLTLPALFAPISTMGHGDEATVAASINQRAVASNMPEHEASRAFGAMARVFLARQIDPDQIEQLAEATRVSERVLAELYQTYGTTPPPAAGAAPPAGAAVATTADDWEIG